MALGLPIRLPFPTGHCPARGGPRVHEQDGKRQPARRREGIGAVGQSYRAICKTSLETHMGPQRSLVEPPEANGQWSGVAARGWTREAWGPASKVEQHAGNDSASPTKV